MHVGDRGEAAAENEGNGGPIAVGRAQLAHWEGIRLGEIGHWKCEGALSAMKARSDKTIGKSTKRSTQRGEHGVTTMRREKTNEITRKRQRSAGHLLPRGHFVN